MALTKLTRGIPPGSPYKPEETLEKLEAFGNEQYPITHEWPTKEELKKLPLEKQIKLNKISYKTYRDTTSWISSIQLGFTNDISSSLFETK